MSNREGTTSTAERLNPTCLDWGVVLQTHERSVRIVIRSRLGESQAIDEVWQDVALAAVEQRAPLNEPGKVGSWLRRVALRQCLLYRRRRGRWNKLVSGFIEQGGPSDSHPVQSDPLNWLIQVERLQSVRTALTHLSARDKEILLLKYTEGWSYRQLAQYLEIAESTLETRLHRARQRLRDLLAEPRRDEAR